MASDLLYFYLMIDNKVYLNDGIAKKKKKYVINADTLFMPKTVAHK